MDAFARHLYAIQEGGAWWFPRWLIGGPTKKHTFAPHFYE
jgi:hypothetical protein